MQHQGPKFKRVSSLLRRSVPSVRVFVPSSFALFAYIPAPSLLVRSFVYVSRYEHAHNDILRSFLPPERNQYTDTHEHKRGRELTNTTHSMCFLLCCRKERFPPRSRKGHDFNSAKRPFVCESVEASLCVCVFRGSKPTQKRMKALAHSLSLFTRNSFMFLLSAETTIWLMCPPLSNTHTHARGICVWSILSLSRFLAPAVPSGQLRRMALAG